MKTGEAKKGRTAIVVIHGIGEQNPFETLDSFTCGLFRALKDSQRECVAEHRIIERTDPGTGAWTESYVQLTPCNGSGDIIDVHECYWAYLTEEMITLPEIIDWVEKTLLATKNFYRENEEMGRHYKKLKLTKVSWYLFLIGLAYPFFRLVAPLARAFSRYLPFRVLEWLTSKVKKRATKMIVGYIGDIAIYTTTDQKSKFFPIRQRVLTNAQGLIEAMLKEENYDKIIVAGHSLGSVIAHDTLNRLNIKANLDPESEKLIKKKVKGLITFGSPLDKVAFFFSEHAKNDQNVRGQIIEHLHSFKAKQNINTGNGGFPVGNSIKPKLDGIPWMNFHSPSDPISGHLDFYAIPDKDNVELNLPQRWGVAHIGYWTHEKFYQDIIERFL